MVHTEDGLEGLRHGHLHAHGACLYGAACGAWGSWEVRHSLSCSETGQEASTGNVTGTYRLW